MDAIKTGGLIAQARRERELTQRDLAETLHVSVQAVSKWENGRSCPDIGLLEPLAEALGLTVTELLSGQRGERPGEETVRDSLRFGENQLRPKIRRWKWLFLLAAALLLAILLRAGYVWVRDNTELLPQKETVLTPIELEEQQAALVDLLSNQDGTDFLRMYDAVLADDMDGVLIRAELWSLDQGRERELMESWDLVNLSGLQEIQESRRQLVAFRLTVPDDGSIHYRIRVGSRIISGPAEGRVLEGFPCPVIGMSWESVDKPIVVDREKGAVLLRVNLNVDPGNGFPPETSLLIKMYWR